MAKKFSSMQGTSAFIEKHYEALSYYHQEKKCCYFCKAEVCHNAESKQHEDCCIGYTKCSDFISEERYQQKILDEGRKNGTVTTYKRKVKKSKKRKKQVK